MKKIVIFVLIAFIFILPTHSHGATPAAKQLIIVTHSSTIKTQAKFETYEKIKGKWKRVHSPMTAYIGYNGMTAKKREGDGKTPSGYYSIGTAFGSAKAPKNLKIPYRKTTKYDYWIDDTASKDYNKWISYKGNPLKKWNSFERLNRPLYKYAAVIRYNENPIVKGKGSAIFLHVVGKSKKTAGCVALTEKNLLKVLTWLDKTKHPKIKLGTTAEIKKFKKSVGITK